MKRSIWIGFDPREQDAFRVCLASMRQHLTSDIPIFAVAMDELRRYGFYYRQTHVRDGRLWDVISDAPMSTEFAITRFLVPTLAERGLALFMDCDMLVRSDVTRLFDDFDPDLAIKVVKHDHKPDETIKMDGQIQTAYPRKNWSSVVMWNANHPANRHLTVERVNKLPGRSLHAFSWLLDHEIGELDHDWNHLVGVDPPNPDAKIVHFTLGIPTMPGYDDCEHALEWWRCAIAENVVAAPPWYDATLGDKRCKLDRAGP